MAANICATDVASAADAVEATAGSAVAAAAAAVLADTGGAATVAARLLLEVHCSRGLIPY